VGRRILDINEVERTWIAGNQQVVRSFAIERGVLTEESASLDPPVLDAAWAAWLEIHVRGQDDPNSIINAFGMAFGQVLADRFGLEWKVVTDVVTDIALCRQPGDVVIYPQNLVARRYMAGTELFFDELATEMETSLGRPERAEAAPVAGSVEAAVAAAMEAAVAAVAASAPRKAAGSVKSAGADESANAGEPVDPGKTKRPKSAVGSGKPPESPAAPVTEPAASPVAVGGSAARASRRGTR